MPGTTLGDIFNDAQTALLRARDAEPSRGPALNAATAQLSRLTGTLMLYPSAVLPVVWVEGTRPWVNAASALVHTLERASDHLAGQAIGDPSGSASEPGSQAWHLSRAADILASGNELLGTHLTGTAPSGADRGRWARVIGSPQLTAALVDEISSQASHAAEVADQLASRSQDNGATCDPAVLSALRTAGHWLRQCGHIPASQAAMGDAVLLRAIEAADVRERITPQPGEPYDAFMAGIDASAQRLVRISAGLPGKARTSPAISADAWASAARSAGVVCGLGQMILRDLTWPERPRQLTPPPGALHLASLHASMAGRAWNRVSSAWDGFRTDSLQQTTPTTIEAGDLATRVSRLAFDDPAWTPGRGRSNAGMNTREVVSILHQAADSLAYMAAGDLEAIAAACLAGRVYEIGPSIPRKSGPALGQIKHVGLTDAEPLRAAYAQAVEATEAFARELDSIALTGATRSELLARVRSAAPLECDVTWHHHRDPAIELAIPGRGGHAPGPVEDRLRTMGVSDPVLLQQADTLDRAAEELLGHAQQTAPAAPGTGKSRSRRRAAAPTPRTLNRSGRKDTGRGD